MEHSESFEQALKLFDKHLSVRKSTHVPGKFIIERKAWIPEFELGFLRRRGERAYRFASNTLDPTKMVRTLQVAKEVSEEYESARNGKRIVLWADNLDRRVFDMLAARDIQRYGGYSRFLDEVDRQDEERDKKLEVQLANDRDNLHREAYDKLNFAWKHKQTELLAGKSPWA